MLSRLNHWFQRKEWAHFWYSEEQNAVRDRLGDPRVYAKILGLFIVEYTEMRRGLFALRPIGKWKDYRYLGFGFFSGRGSR